MSTVAFRFDAPTHAYTLADTGQRLPNITSMLEQAGWVETLWFTEASRDRGTEVHRLVAQFDMGAIPAEDWKALASAYRGWLLAHEKLTALVRPVWDGIEVPRVEPRYGFAGRIDRNGLVFGATAIAEVKTGPAHYKTVNGYYSSDHAIQTGLQALLLAPEVKLPPEAIKRFGWYLKENGRCVIEAHKDRRDIDEAKRIAKQYGAGPLL